VRLVSANEHWHTRVKSLKRDVESHEEENAALRKEVERLATGNLEAQHRAAKENAALRTLLAEAVEVVGEIRPSYLRNLADWIDIVDKERGKRTDDGVQRDLRKWADSLVALLEKMKEVK